VGKMTILVPPGKIRESQSSGGEIPQLEAYFD